MMKDRSWQKVEAVFHAALALNGGKRISYLEKIGSENEWLRSEVESLLESFDDEPEFMNQPAFNLGLEILGRNAAESLTGRNIGIYRVRGKIGAGGMGDVYLADDTNLNRKVALKFLAASFVDDNWARRQFVREAQALAMLEHPNICPIHGIEKTEKYDFLVMQYVEGETLSQLIGRRNITADLHLPIARQIAEALAAAHSHGIIHRDIKPGNIIITPNGQVKVLDFGLAKIIRQNNKTERGENKSQVSRKNLIFGTVAYMSPEQLRGEKLDYRSDIFSLGVLLCELATNINPFRRETEADTISAILVGDLPSAITRQNGKISPVLKKIIKKCLEKKKESRYQSASELLLELQSPKPITERRHKFVVATNFVIPVLLILSLIFGIFLYLRMTKPQTLAVIPFSNQSNDISNDYLSDGMTEDLIDRLSNSESIKVKSFPLVSGYKGVAVDPLKTGRELNVDAVLTGEIILRNDSLFLRTKLININDGTQIWSMENPFDTSEILNFQKEISKKIVSSLQPLAGETKSEATSPASQTDNPEVYRYYLKGRYYWSKRDEKNIREAITNFNRAIELDPTYARAYTGLADSYVLLSSVAYGSVPTKESMTKAKAAAKQALEIDDHLCESHASLGIVLYKYDRNWTAAEAEFKRAIELDPENATAHFWYSNLLAIVGRADESIAEAEKAKELDPFSPLADMNLGRVFYYARRYDEALVRLNNQDSRSDARVRYLVGLVYLQKGRYEEAARIFENLYAANKLFGGAALGHTYARMGKRTEALKILNELENLPAENHLPPQEKAIIYVGLNDRDRAFKYLEEAFQERYAPLNALKVEPLFDNLRADIRYARLLDRMSLLAP